MKSIHASLILAVAGFAITSCGVTNDSWRGANSSSFGFYNVLPNSFVGSAYYHQNRYYYGGRSERGNFQHNGHSYKERYVHGERQLYGGRTEHHGSDRQRESRQQNVRQSPQGNRQDSHNGRQKSERH